MTKGRGAFIDAFEAAFNADMDEKSKLIQLVLDNPGKYPELESLSGAEWIELMLGDYQRFVDRFPDLK